MKALITGGAGFIGSQLVEFHLNRGDEVLVLDDLSTGKLANVAGFRKNRHFRFEKCNLLTCSGLGDWIRWADRIYHMAAVVGMIRVLQEPVKVTGVNVVGTERLLQAVVEAGVRPHILVASSSSVYGHTHHCDLHEDMELVVSPGKAGLTGYAVSKLINEIQAKAYHETHGLPIAVARLFNAVGPRQSGTYGFVLPRFIHQAAAGEDLTVFGDGTQTRSFCDVRDTVRAMDLLMKTPLAWGRPVNVGNTCEISILELAKLVLQKSGSTSGIAFVPFETGYGQTFQQITQRHPITKTLKTLTGFEPAWTLEATIDDLLRDMQPTRKAR
ncbi:MAG: NAD-dependent epimerase/dehydratase family protein [Terrimicrobiaceae bacterium]